jgi:putative ABC transport system permease protein
MVYHEVLQFAFDQFRTNKVRFMLTAFGMVVGTASLILVVTIGLTGKQYVLNQIQAIGANMITAFYEGGGQRVTRVQSDELSVKDMEAVQAQVPGVIHASPMFAMHDSIPMPGGKQRDVLVLGVSEDYVKVRNLDVVAGRFFDDDDTRRRDKVAVITQYWANAVYGTAEAAVGQTLRLGGLPFTIIGVFRERVETFGQSEVATFTVAIPYTVAEYFTGNDYVHQLFFSAANPETVDRVTQEVKAVLQSRHRPESVYRVENLSQLLSVARKTANALTLVLLLISTVTLVVSGVGIMNIMLATVTSRTREIGIRKAVGATRQEIRYQFLAEALLISLGGGLVGIVIGLAIPWSVRYLTDYRIPISGLSAIIALAVSTGVGVIFGTVPATRAAQLDPVESLRYE